MSVASFILPAMARTKDPEGTEKGYVAARVAPEIIATLKAMAAAGDRTLSREVERALREYIERHAPKDKPKK